jgi:hypothetical protein
VARPDVLAPSDADDDHMRKTYGIVWREGEQPLAHGKLELLPRSVRLEGLADSKPCTREISYESLKGIRVGRSATDRINGRPSLVLERSTGESISITSVAQPGIVAELAERLTALQLNGNKAEKRIAIVLPLKEGSKEAAQSLLAGGPPFDPEQVRLDRHEVFLTEHEAVFLFVSSLGLEALEPLLADPEFWRGAAAWREHLAGPPRFAEGVYSWEKSEPTENLWFLPTPGPGDSDGGDIFGS